MVHLVATIANDAELMPALLFSLRGQVTVPEVPNPNESWGIGYFVDDRALIVRKPASILEERSAFGIGGDLKSRIIIACARYERIQADAPPFRFRRWLFAHTGNIADLGRLQGKVAAKLPDFVQDVLGDEHGGRLAHAMFLTELHRAGLLEEVSADPLAVGGALKRTVDTLLRLAPEAGAENIASTFVASNGRMMAITTANQPVWVRKMDGLERLPDGPVDEARHDFKRVVESLKRFQAQVVALSVDASVPDWRRLEPDASAVFDAALNTHEPLS